MVEGEGKLKAKKIRILVVEEEKSNKGSFVKGTFEAGL